MDSTESGRVVGHAGKWVSAAREWGEPQSGEGWVGTRSKHLPWERDCRTSRSTYICAHRRASISVSTIQRALLAALAWEASKPAEREWPLFAGKHSSPLPFRFSLPQHSAVRGGEGRTCVRISFWSPTSHIARAQRCLSCSGKLGEERMEEYNWKSEKRLKF